VNSFPSWPEFAADEIDAVDHVLRSGKVNYWTGGQGRAFEMEFARYVGTKHAVALANGSVALELALISLGIQPGDEVIVTPRTFIASASSIVLRGATPVFADVDRDSQDLTVDTIRPCITPRTRAIIVVHLAGWPCDMNPILELARERGLVIIEDCAQAHGAEYKGRKVGSFGDISVFSFCQDKIMSTGGEGGMLLTNSDVLWKKAWSYKDHGKSYDAVNARGNTAGSAFQWVHESFGSNWRMTEMQSAIGRIQLGKLDQWVGQRRANAHCLANRLSKLSVLRVPLPDSELSHAYYKFYAFLHTDRLKPGWDRDRLVSAINAAGVPCFSGSCSEVYREKAFTDAGLAPERPLPVAMELGETSLMLPVHPTLAQDDIDRMTQTVEQVMRMGMV
jgi:dTDP-4-amino-4,6-dideoxygalactose transaminase